MNTVMIQSSLVQSLTAVLFLYTALCPSVYFLSPVLFLIADTPHSPASVDWTPPLPAPSQLQAKFAASVPRNLP